MIIVNNQFNIGQHVYMLTDEEQALGIITSITIITETLHMYTVSYGRGEAVECYDYELTEEKNHQQL